MQWASFIHKSESVESAVQKTSDDLKKEFGRAQPDIGFLFVASALKKELIDLWPELRAKLPVKSLIGCTGGGVIGGRQEVEDESAVSLVAAHLPNVAIQTFDVRQNQLPSIDGSPRPWRDLLKTPAEPRPQFVVISDPFSMDADVLVSGLDFAYPESVKIGGLASGGIGPRENLLIHNEKLMTQGAVGAAFTGDISVEPVVAQGCRPIGDPLPVTDCRENVILAVDGMPPLQYLSRLFHTLSKRDQDLLTHSLFIGIITDSFNENPRAGDYLIRNIIGVDQEKGVLAVGARIRPGQTIQFHLRDANTSRDDLKLLLSRSQSAGRVDGSSGAVLFSCLGRGERLYGKPNHDIELMKSVVGDIPVGGFFCSGEIGPIGGKTYLHGYTSSIGIFSAGNGEAHP